MKINQTQTTLELQGCPSISSVVSSTYPLKSPKLNSQ